MTSTTQTRQGSCLCGAITFTLTGPPQRNIQCNCLNCQKSSGSAFLTNILYKKDQYTITSGQSNLKIYNDTATTSGGKLERAFCSECGSPMSIRNVSNPKMSGNIVIPAGVVEGSYLDFVPQSELFGERRHQWVAEVKKPGKKGAKI